jgi:hypothetical protein
VRGAISSGRAPRSRSWPLATRLGAQSVQEAVQHGSTATHPDAGGRAGTREDGDLQG